MSVDKPLNELTASQAAALLATGEIESEALVRACLARIAQRESHVRAWASVNAEGALHAAREADKLRIAKRPLGPLHGIPIGIKDNIATEDMPTEYNSEFYAKHRPSIDASAVTILRAAGAIILGKTETVEFAAWGGRVAPTRNPKDLARTPGGSSSGSAAAVADHMVPLALGTQTGGSLIRPASYCGVVAVKPTFGTVSMEGVKPYAPTLDTLGWYSRCVEDAQLLAYVMEVADEPAESPMPVTVLHVGICQTPYWDMSLPEGRAALAEARRRLEDAGATVSDLTLPPEFSELDDHRQTVMWAEGRISFLDILRVAAEKISRDIRKSMEPINKSRLCNALDYCSRLRRSFDELAGRFDAVLVPSAPGEAPEGLMSTGNSIFNGLWTILHVPCINLPGLTGSNGLPVGIQLVAPRYSDGKLLAVAKTLSQLLLH